MPMAGRSTRPYCRIVSTCARWAAGGSGAACAAARRRRACLRVWRRFAWHSTRSERARAHTRTHMRCACARSVQTSTRARASRRRLLLERIDGDREPDAGARAGG
eukprot:4427737-Prymnesium_polylepis.2